MAKKKNAAAKEQNQNDTIAETVAAALTPEKKSPKLNNTELPEEPSTINASPTNTSTDETKVIKINTCNLSELKNTVDDAVKEFYGRDFVRSHLHEDVRIALGWSAVLVSFATGYYGYVVEFQQSKFWCTIGVTIYIILNSIYWAYANYVEKDTIFQGKRRTFASRITTENLVISSNAKATATPPPSFPFSLFYPKSSTTNSTSYPNYHLSVSYIHSSNNGKSLIRSHSTKFDKCFGAWFDQEGRMAKSILEADLKAVLDECVEGQKE